MRRRPASAERPSRASARPERNPSFRGKPSVYLLTRPSRNPWPRVRISRRDAKGRRDAKKKRNAQMKSWVHVTSASPGFHEETRGRKGKGLMDECHVDKPKSSYCKGLRSRIRRLSNLMNT